MQLQSHICLTASLYMIKYLRISSDTRKPFLIYDFTTVPIWISLYMRYEENFVFFFISVLTRLWREGQLLSSGSLCGRYQRVWASERMTTSPADRLIQAVLLPWVHLQQLLRYSAQYRKGLRGGPSKQKYYFYGGYSESLSWPDQETDCTGSLYSKLCTCIKINLKKTSPQYLRNQI